MFDLSTQINTQKTISFFVLSALLTQIIVGGILLPYQQAQACVDIIGGPSGILNFIANIGNYIWTAAKWVYQNAQAAITAAYALWEKSQTILKEALKVAWNILRKKLLDMIVNDIISWIQGGGKPRFVTDWQSFLKNAADKAAGQLLDKMSLGFLCDKFSLQLRLSLAAPPTFDETATCTLSTAISNIDNFMTDFSKGGWKGWVTISESQNNYMGAYFLALNKKYEVMANAADAAKNEAASSASFLDDKVCSQRQCTPGVVENYSGSSLGWKPDELDQGGGTSCECVTWVTITPGRVAGDALQQALGVDIANLIQAKEFAEYAAAIIDAAINRVFKEGVALFDTTKNDGTSAGKTGPGISTPATVSANISDYTSAVTNESQAQLLIPQQKLLKENQNKLLPEYQTNLSILNQTKTAQLSGLAVLIDLYKNGCALPAGVSVSDISSTRKKLVATGTGEAILERSGSSYTTISTTATVETDITIINTAITNLQNDITKITTAITDTEDYQTKAAAYITAYESGSGTPATIAAKTAMDTAYTKAITSLQAAIPSTSTSLKTLTEKIEEKNNNIATTISSLMTKRGGDIGCTYYSSMLASLYKTLCTAQANIASWQTSLSSCLNP